MSTYSHLEIYCPCGYRVIGEVRGEGRAAEKLALGDAINLLQEHVPDLDFSVYDLDTEDGRHAAMNHLLDAVEALE